MLIHVGFLFYKNKIKSYKSALACDPISAFGGIVSFNFKVTQKISFRIKKYIFMKL